MRTVLTIGCALAGAVGLLPATACTPAGAPFPSRPDACGASDGSDAASCTDAPRCSGPVDPAQCLLASSPPACGNGILEPGEACDPGGEGPCGPDCRFSDYGCVGEPRGPVAFVCNDEASFLQHAEEFDRYTFDDGPAGSLLSQDYIAAGIRIWVESGVLELWAYDQEDSPWVVSLPNLLAQACGPPFAGGYCSGPFYFQATQPVRAFSAWAWGPGNGGVLEYWVYEDAPPASIPGASFVAGVISADPFDAPPRFLGLVLRCDFRSVVIASPKGPTPAVAVDDVLLACPRE